MQKELIKGTPEHLIATLGEEILTLEAACDGAYAIWRGLQEGTEEKLAAAVRYDTIVEKLADTAIALNEARRQYAYSIEAVSAPLFNVDQVKALQAA